MWAGIKKITGRRKIFKVIKFLLLFFVLAAAGRFIIMRYFFTGKALEAKAYGIFVPVEQGKTIQKVISGSGVAEPLNSYEVSALAEGKVTSADFKEGDLVKKGQILYRISTDDIDSLIATAKVKVERAQKSLQEAKDNYSNTVKDYEKAQQNYKKDEAEYGDPKVRTPLGGIVKTLYLSENTTYQKNAQIAQIYDNTYMLLTVPFSASDAKEELVGKSAQVTLDAGMETVKGTVTKVNALTQTLEGRRVVKEVEIKVKNPGGISESMTATASIGSLCSAASGSFSPFTDQVITAGVSGKIEKIYVQEGERVKAGDVMFILSEDSIKKVLEADSNATDAAWLKVENADDKVDAAKAALDTAKSSLESGLDSKTDYTILAPVSGKVITKSVVAGDVVSSKSTAGLCEIYDLSSLIFSMDVDEYDIKKIKEGEKVNVTADALGNTQLTGKVINVSLDFTVNAGVTKYPVTIRLENPGKLLPGMNVKADIVIEEATDCIAVPNDALMQKNTVYVKDDSVKEAVGRIPAGCKKVEVVTGITDGDYTQIVSGLNGTEKLYIARNIGNTSTSAYSRLLSRFFRRGSGSTRSSGSGNRWSGGSGSGSSTSGRSGNWNNGGR